MKLENGYKLIYEVVEEGVREFRASKTGIPTADDFVLTSNTIGENKLVYEYNGKFYGTGEKSIPTYNEDGTPADIALISDEAFAEVFVAKEPVEDEADGELDGPNAKGPSNSGENELPGLNTEMPEEVEGGDF